MKRYIDRLYVSAVIRLTHHDGSPLDVEEHERFVRNLVTGLLNTIEPREDEKLNFFDRGNLVNGIPYAK